MLEPLKIVSANPNLRCGRCGNPFHCEIQAGKDTCWCFKYPVLKGADKTATQCFCEDCLKDLTEKTEC